MQGEQVVLTDMLQCRERRAQIQDTFIEQYHCPVHHASLFLFPH